MYKCKKCGSTFAPFGVMSRWKVDGEWMYLCDNCAMKHIHHHIYGDD